MVHVRIMGMLDTHVVETDSLPGQRQSCLCVGLKPGQCMDSGCNGDSCTSM